jgi:hypothetical protein
MNWPPAKLPSPATRKILTNLEKPHSMRLFRSHDTQNSMPESRDKCVTEPRKIRSLPDHTFDTPPPSCHCTGKRGGEEYPTQRGKHIFGASR